MGNKCYQSLIITGHQATVEEIILRLKEDDRYIKFSNILPLPSHTELNKLGMSESEWCNTWYGTRFDFGILFDIEIVENQGRIDFHTSYLPCRQFVFQLCRMFDDVSFYLSFTEPLGNFQGYVECRNGEVLQ